MAITLVVRGYKLTHADTEFISFDSQLVKDTLQFTWSRSTFLLTNWMVRLSGRILSKCFLRPKSAKFIP